MQDSGGDKPDHSFAGVTHYVQFIISKLVWWYIFSNKFHGVPMYQPDTFCFLDAGFVAEESRAAYLNNRVVRLECPVPRKKCPNCISHAGRHPHGGWWSDTVKCSVTIGKSSVVEKRINSPSKIGRRKIFRKQKLYSIQNRIGRVHRRRNKQRIIDKKKT